MARGVATLGEKIAQARKALGDMTQKALALKAKVSLRTVERAEKSERIDKSNFRKIVAALVGPKASSRLEDELLLYQQFDEEQCHDVSAWLATASCFDRQGEPQRAADCVKTVVDSLNPAHPYYAAACITLATFYDHLNRFEEAVEVATRVICRREEDGQFDDGSYFWAIYQRGIGRRKMAEDLRSRSWTITPAVQKLLDAARKDFEKVRESEDERHQVSASHHLAVLDQHLGQYHKAIKLLRKCLQMRQKSEGKSTADPEARTRQAFDYRRLGQCYALLAHAEHNEQFRHLAKEYFSLARQLATGNKRVVKEIDDDIKAFGPGLA